MESAVWQGQNTHKHKQCMCCGLGIFFSTQKLASHTTHTSLGKTNLFFLRSNESLEGFVFLQEQVTLVDTLTQLVSGQVDLCMYIRGSLCTMYVYTGSLCTMYVHTYGGHSVRMCMAHPMCVAIDIVRVRFTIVLLTKPKLLVKFSNAAFV